jgi:hypothetical protein
VQLDDDSYDVILQYITSSLKVKGNNAKIIYNWPGEGFLINVLIMMNKLNEVLINEYNIPIKNLIYVTAAANVTANIKFYQQCKDIFPYIPTEVYCSTSWESQWLTSMGPNIPDHSLEPLRDKKFMFLNRGARLHRIAALSDIFSRGLMDKCHVSFYQTGYNAGLMQEIFPTTVEDIIKNQDEIQSLLPIKLTLTDDYNNMYVLNQEDMELHQSTLFSLITETLFISDINKITNPKIISAEQMQQNALCFPCILISEKTWRTIRYKHPFIILGHHGSLAALRELGYKTFHPFINEEYDTIENDEKRLIAVMDEVERLTNMTLTETEAWLKNVHEVTQFNSVLNKSRHVQSATKLGDSA